MTFKYLSLSRLTGPKGGPGTFVLEDYNGGTEWELTAVESKEDPTKVTMLNQIDCLTAGYELSWELRGDMQDAVKGFIDNGG